MPDGSIVTIYKYRGRDVVVGIIPLGDYLDAQALAAKSANANDAMWYVMTKAARFQDDGSLVFPSFESLRQVPTPELPSLMAMSEAAFRLNFPHLVEGATPVPSV